VAGVDLEEGLSPAVELSGVRFAWKRKGAFHLDIDAFRVERGEKLLLIGPSGSGKSTLLGLICGSIRPSGGSVAVLGQNLVAMSSPARDAFRAEHVGVVFQMFNLIPYLSIVDNVLLPLSFAAGRRRRANAGDGSAAEARRLLAALGLDLATLGRSSAAELSVGEQQRVAAARALIGGPEIIVADEPTSALDRDRQEAFLTLLFAELARGKATLIMVSHEERFAGRFDRTVRLGDIARSAPVAAAGAAP
jgi:putative ABC transport system ATP-binding protein